MKALHIPGGFYSALHDLQCRQVQPDLVVA